MLKALKLTALSFARRSQVSTIARNSRWRQRRLLILCYHGVSLCDEHLWNPDLYMDAGLLRQRFARLRQQGCSVLPLDEALVRLAHDDLPARAVTLTFDDGSYDFYERALPLLGEFGFPATVYYSTYYAEYNRPVFNTMCSYLLWKAGERRLELPDVLAQPIDLNAAGRAGADLAIKTYARNMSGTEKDDLLAALAERLQIDYRALCDRRLLHLMTLEEARACADAGVDIQLHTHRHRTPLDPTLFTREIDENRQRIEAISPAPARHFCYPSGFHQPQVQTWLQRAGIRSATTCEPGMASRQTDPLLLPRLVDGTRLTMTEFDGWVSGLASFLPRRRHVIDLGIQPDFAGADQLSAR